MDSESLNPANVFSLEGLDEPAARSYLASIVSHLHQTETELKAADADVVRWSERIVLAENSLKPELAAQARVQREIAVQKRTKLEMEVWEFRDGVESLKKQLQILPSTHRSINPQALLETLETMAGPLDPIAPLARQASADEALAALKKRLSDEEGS